MFCRPIMLYMLNFVSENIRVTERRKYFSRGPHVGQRENVWGYAYSKNRSSLLLLSVSFDAMTTRLFLPANRRLILE